MSSTLPEAYLIQVANLHYAGDFTCLTEVILTHFNVLDWSEANNIDIDRQITK